MAARLRKIPRRTAVLVCALVVLVGVGGGAAWAATRSRSSAATSASIVATVSKSTVSQSVSTSGTIEPAKQADLSFAVSGTVKSVKVAVGDKVVKGQALATVGRSELTAAVTVAKASLTSAQESLTSAESSSSTTSLALASAKAQVASAKSTLAAAKTSLADATLRSTIAGTVADVGISTGDTVGSSSGSSSSAASTSSSSSSAAVTVISTSSWLVNATVGSADLASVKKGQSVQITPTDATTQVSGTVTSVGIVASSSSDSTSSSATFPVVIAVKGSPQGLYAGGSATVAIIVKQVTGVLTVPTAALHSSGNQTYVELQKDGSTVKTDVTIGSTYGASTEITAGLSSGDKVVVTTITGGPRSTTGNSGSSSGQTGGTGGGFGSGTGGGFGAGGTGGIGGTGGGN